MILQNLSGIELFKILKQNIIVKNLFKKYLKYMFIHFKH